MIETDTRKLWRIELAKKGHPSQIGIILRDSHEAAQMRFRSANKILRIVKSVVGFDLDLPKDSYYLIKKEKCSRH